MIINCRCGKYQFDVKKSDIGTSGREVQCGICNEKWFHGGSASSSNEKKESNLSQEYKTPLTHKIIFFFIYVTAIIGFLDLMKNKLIIAGPAFQDYYAAKEKIILKIIAFLQ